MSVTVAILLPFESNPWKSSHSFASKVLANLKAPEFYVVYPDDTLQDKTGEARPLGVSMRARNPLLFNSPTRHYDGVPRAAVIVHFKVPAGWDGSKPFPDEAQPYAYSRWRWHTSFSSTMDVYSIGGKARINSSLLKTRRGIDTAIHFDAAGKETGRSVKGYTPEAGFIYRNEGPNLPTTVLAALPLMPHGLVSSQ